eukprot:scaffold161878_cov37-Tisochrysis_lutea.AAC.2
MCGPEHRLDVQLRLRVLERRLRVWRLAARSPPVCDIFRPQDDTPAGRHRERAATDEEEPKGRGRDPPGTR